MNSGDIAIAMYIHITICVAIVMGKLPHSVTIAICACGYAMCLRIVIKYISVCTYIAIYVYSYGNIIIFCNYIASYRHTHITGCLEFKVYVAI